jgi:hypothetical protein
MRFMMMHKNQPSTEAGERPSMDVVTQMGQFVGGYAKSGRFLDGAGLGASKTRIRLVFKDGRSTVKHGPYKGEHELPSSLLLLKVKTREEALGWAERYGKILGDGEIELGKVVEAWDLGLMPAPENPPLQMLLIDKADKATESGGRTTEQKAALTRLRTEMTKAGVLLRTTHLEPSSNAKRLRFTNNVMHVHDGPFIETKELIGGFAVFELSGFEEALETCKRYVEILGGTLEIDVRRVEPSEDAAHASACAASSSFHPSHSRPE